MQRRKARVEYDLVRPDVVEVRIIGELALASVPSVTHLFRQLIKAGHCRMVINLSQTTYIASSGIGCFISIAEEARQRRGEVIIAGAPEKIMHVFNIMGLGRILQFTSTSREAISQLKQSA